MRALRPATVPRPALLPAPAFTLFLALTFFSATAQTGTAQAATAQTGTAQTETAQTGTARAATAQSGYRYWSFWQQKDNGSWSYATQGPAVLRPDDGETLGFRFALSEDSRDAEQPRGTTDFTDACAHTPKKSGTKRVAIRIDFGTPADAPKGEPKSPPKPRTECVRVDDTASAADALAAVATPSATTPSPSSAASAAIPPRAAANRPRAGRGTGRRAATGATGAPATRGRPVAKVTPVEVGTAVATAPCPPASV